MIVKQYTILYAKCKKGNVWDDKVILAKSMKAQSFPYCCLKNVCFIHLHKTPIVRWNIWKNSDGTAASKDLDYKP